MFKGLLKMMLIFSVHMNNLSMKSSILLILSTDTLKIFDMNFEVEFSTRPEGFVG